MATEIKELARQTSDATGDISSRMNGCSNLRMMSYPRYDQISTLRNDVNEIVSTIAAAVEEQSAVTKKSLKMCLRRHLVFPK